tara:strand:+ start:123 stop:1067 length:945 start_codon:yes stop_codon:yes gene_type:complete
MKNLISVTFLLLCFYSFSQDYQLDVIFERLDNNTYIIKNYSQKTVGFLRLNFSNKNEFRYFNINNDLVGKELLSKVYRDGISLFDLKATTEVLNSLGEPIHTRFWDEEQGRFNLFLDGEEIGYLKNNKLKKQWEYYKNTFLDIDAYANFFKIKSKPKVIFNDPPNNYATNKKQKTKSLKVKKFRSKRNIGIYGTGLSVSENNGMRFGLDFFSGDNSIGLTMRVVSSDIVYNDDPLYDWDIGVTYGTGILNNLAYMKFGLGVYSYNYDIMESFGPFYDIGITAYYSFGLQIDLGVFTPEIYYNNMGIGYGIGFVF